MSLYRRSDSRIWWAAISLPDGVAYAALVARRTGKKRRNGLITCAQISGASTA